MKLILPIFVLVFFGFYALPVLKAQEVETLPLLEGNPARGKLQSNLVKLDVSVWDAKTTNFLKNLTHKDFEVREDKENYDIEYFAKQEGPISIGILFDLSGSIQNTNRPKFDEIPSAVEGLIAFIGSSNPDNEYFIIGFAQNSSVLLKPTQDKKEVEKALEKVLSIKLKGNTSVFDALKTGVDNIGKTKFERKLLILVSDGQDTSSKENDFDDIKDWNRRSGSVPVHMINILRSDEPLSPSMLDADKYFKTITEDSGGRIYYPRKHEDVLNTFSLIAEEMKSQYRLGINPNGPETKSWHKIKVKFKTPATNSKNSVRAPKGFYY